MTCIHIAATPQLPRVLCAVQIRNKKLALGLKSIETNEGVLKTVNECGCT